jgi:hypothetical protein
VPVETGRGIGRLIGEIAEARSSCRRFSVLVRKSAYRKHRTCRSARRASHQSTIMSQLRPHLPWASSFPAATRRAITRP